MDPRNDHSPTTLFDLATWGPFGAFHKNQGNPRFPLKGSFKGIWIYGHVRTVLYGGFSKKIGAPFWEPLYDKDHGTLGSILGLSMD